MKHLIHTLFLCVSFTLLGQSKKVKLHLSYRNNPLCYWNVTICHGDLKLASGKSDASGTVEFSSVKLLSNSIDANGIKTTANGEKKWDVKGYITLDDKGEANFDFEKLVQESGMSATMLEAAWGLTLNDCSNDNSTSGGSSSLGSNSGNKSEEMSKWDAEQEKKRKEEEAKREEFQEDWQSGKTQAEGFENQRQMHLKKLEELNGKVSRKKQDLARATLGTEEHSDAAYELRFVELERDLRQVKLDKTNQQIANGNTTLTKSQREEFNIREENLENELDRLKKQKKSLVRFDGTTPNSEAKSTSEKLPDPVVEDNSKANPPTKGNEKSVKEEKPTESDKVKEEADDAIDAPLKLPNEKDFLGMSTMELKKLKLDCNGKIGRRKAVLKTKGAFLSPDKKTTLETHITDLQKLIASIELELAKRKEEK